MKAIIAKDEVIHKLDLSTLQAPETASSTPDSQRVHTHSYGALVRRIRDLEKVKNEREEALERHASKFQALRQSHNALVESMRLSHETEIASLKESMKAMDTQRTSNPDTEELKRLRKREKELLRVTRDQEEELEALRQDNEELRNRLTNVERMIAQRDGELKIAERRVKRMSEMTVSLERRSNDEENEEIMARLAEEIRYREEAERELDEVVMKHKAELEEALSLERSKAREEHQRLVAGERRKRDDYKAAAWKEVEDVIRDEEEKRIMVIAAAQDELKARLAQEEKRRAELAAGLSAKLAELEQARRVDLDDFELRLGVRKEAEQILITQNQGLQSRITELQTLLDSDKDAIESLKHSNEDTMRLARRVVERLGEEKQRNKHLEETVRSMTALSMYPGLTGTTSDDPHLSEEITQLKLQIEDRDGKVNVLKTELDAWKTEMKAADEAWRKLDAEAKGFHELMAEKDLRIQDLEQQNSLLTDTVGMYRAEYGKLKKRTSAKLEKAQDQALDTSQQGGGDSIEPEVANKDLAENGDGEGDDEKADTTFNLLEQLSEAQTALAEANKEIHLYKLDVKGYRKDVRRREAKINNLTAKITQLESDLYQKGLELQGVQDELHIERRLPQPTASPHIADENTQILAGKISFVKDENLQLRQRVRMAEDSYRTCNNEKEGLKKTLEQYTAQQGLVITDLERRMEKLREEKEIAEKKHHNALKQAAEMKTTLPLPPLPLKDDDDFAETALAVFNSPPPQQSELEQMTSQATVSKFRRRRSTSQGSGGHKRSYSHPNTSHTVGLTRSHSHNRAISIGNKDGTTTSPSPITIVGPPQFPSPTTPLPPLPPKSPIFSPLSSTHHQQAPGSSQPHTTLPPRPGTASSDDDFSPLGVLNSPLGFHPSPLSAAPKRKKVGEEGVKGGKGEKRLSVVVEPPPMPKLPNTRRNSARRESYTHTRSTSTNSYEGKQLPQLPPLSMSTPIPRSSSRGPLSVVGSSAKPHSSFSPSANPIGRVAGNRMDGKVRLSAVVGIGGGEGEGIDEREKGERGGVGCEGEKEEERCEVVFW